MSFYTIYRYFKNAPIIELGNNGIKIKSSKNENSFAFSDIKKIDITGKVPFKYVFTFPMEGLTITLNHGKTIYVYGDMYSNAWQLKSYLSDVIIKKCEPIEHDEIVIDKSNVDYDCMQLFKGNQFISFRGIILWVPIAFYIFLFFIKGFNPPIGFLIFFTIYIVFWFLFNSYLMHYFGIDKDFLIVRNHNLIWINKIYQIQDIKEVVFETRNKMPNMLRVITKNFKSRLYPAGTLRTRDWLTLKTELETRNITVRNECIY